MERMALSRPAGQDSAWRSLYGIPSYVAAVRSIEYAGS
jgi:hypothetical protein